MAHDPAEVADWVALWIEHDRDLEEHRSGADVDARSAVVNDRLDDLIRHEPEEAWRLIGILVEHLPVEPKGEGAFGFMAAGPLEDFVVDHGLAYLDRLEVAARRSERWRAALRGVWGWTTGSIHSEVVARLEPILGPGLY